MPAILKVRTKRKFILWVKVKDVFIIKKTRQEGKNLYNENAEGIERLLAEAQASPL
jgi:hypothetical protein